MRESYGTTQTLNIVIIFIIITFAFVAGTLSYAKAYKVNSAVAKIIETYEGNIGAAQNEIRRVLSSLGYQKGTPNCQPNINVGGKTGVLNDVINDYDICLYYYSEDNKPSSKKNNQYYGYSIKTFLSLDIPLIGTTLKIPVNSRSERIFYFTERS